MEARERRPQSKLETKLEKALPAEINKEKLKKAFDFSHFDINAILRGIELTLVGGVYSEVQVPSCCLALTPTLQQTELFKIQACSPVNTTSRPPMPLQRALSSVCLSMFRCVLEDFSGPGSRWCEHVLTPLLDCWSSTRPVVHIVHHQPGCSDLGREDRGKLELHGGPCASGTTVPHDLDALHHAHAGQLVRRVYSRRRFQRCLLRTDSWSP